MAEQVTRLEIKYIVPYVAYKQMEPQLLAQLALDAHGGPDGYAVRSLYFDSYRLDDQKDVLDGLEARKKIRLRVYSPKDASAKLEYKQKRGPNQMKHSIPVAREQAQALMGGDYSYLLTLPDPIANRMYGEMQVKLYRPKVLIEYERKAFIYPAGRVRVTYDTHVRASQTNLDLFDPGAALSPVMRGDAGVLEVKYDAFLPSFIKRILDQLDGLPQNNSKYLQGLSLYMG